MQKSPDSKVTFSRVTDQLGQLCQLMHDCPFGSDEHIALLDEYIELLDEYDGFKRMRL